MTKNRVLRLLAKFGGVLLAGGLLLTAGIAALPTGIVVALKVAGRAPDCPWSRVLKLEHTADRFQELEARMRSSVKIVEEDTDWQIVKVRSPNRDFWVRKSGGWDGARLVAHLLAEHQWDAENTPEMAVRKGETVIDCGGHIGVYTYTALEAGAKYVVGIEPDPVNAECYRRNFKSEIADGRVTLVEKGAWSSRSSMELTIGETNSGMSSMVNVHGRRKVTVPVEPIDDMVAALKLARVDAIKMDIEGAEREALKGASQTLKKWRPRLMLDANHRPDDLAVLPNVIRGANQAYEFECGGCEIKRPGWRIEPHVIYFR